MIPADLIQKVKHLEIKTRQVVQSAVAGEYHSVFKGQGLHFSEHRAYQPGDDVRLIDWKVTARFQHPYIKLFEEERELTVLLMVDLSPSTCLGTQSRTKRATAAEVAALLGFSASMNHDRSGLLLFSDCVEHVVLPKKGKTHIYRILRDIFSFEAKGRRTDIRLAIDTVLRVQKKQATIFLISDFFDSGYDDSLTRLAKRHEVVPIVLADPRDQLMPDVGVVEFEDSESGIRFLMDTGSDENRMQYRHIALSARHQRDRLFRSLGLAPLYLDTDADCALALQRYFAQRIHPK